jgi:hypothetical protein
MEKKKPEELWELIRSSEKADSSFFEKMRKARDFYEGLQLGSTHSKGVISANLTLGAIQSQQATLFVSSPRVTVTSPSPDLEGNEKIWQTLINTVLPKTEFGNAISDSVLDASIFAEGWLKLTYVGEDEAKTSESSTRLAGFSNKAGARWHREAPYRVIVDKLAPGRDHKQARFIAFKYYKDRDDLLFSDIYDLSDFKQKDGVSPLGMDADDKRIDSLDTNITQEHFDGLSVIPIYEVWVENMPAFGMKKQVIVFEGETGTVIREPLDWSEFLGADFSGWPVERLVFNPVPDKVPLSEVDSWKVLQRALNYVLSKLVQFLRKQKTIFMLNTDKVKNPSNARKQLMSSRAVEVIETVEDGAVQVDNTAAIPPDIYNLINQIIALWDRTASISSTQSGNVRNIRTATEAQQVGQANQASQSKKLAQVEELLTSCIEKWCMLTMATIKGEQVIRLTGNAGAVEWAKFEPDDIKWLPGIEIVADSFRTSHQQQEIQKWTTALQMVLKALPATGPSVRVDLLLAEALRAVGIPGVSEFLSSQPQQAMAQMAEITQLAAGVPVQLDPNDDDQVHLQVLDQYLNSPAAAGLEFEGKQALMQHQAQHEQALKEKQGASAGAAITSQDNPMVGLNLGDGGRQVAADSRSFSDLGNGQSGGF